MKFYLVLSVKQINRLARAAKASQKKSKAGSSHTVLLNLETALTFKEQLGSWSFDEAVAKIEKDNR